MGCISKSVEVNQVAVAGEKQFEARKEKKRVGGEGKIGQILGKR